MRRRKPYAPKSTLKTDIENIVDSEINQLSNQGTGHQITHHDEPHSTQVTMRNLLKQCKDGEDTVPIQNTILEMKFHA